MYCCKLSYSASEARQAVLGVAVPSPFGTAPHAAGGDTLLRFRVARAVELFCTFRTDTAIFAGARQHIYRRHGHVSRSTCGGRAFL